MKIALTRPTRWRRRRGLALIYFPVANYERTQLVPFSIRQCSKTFLPFNIIRRLVQTAEMAENNVDGIEDDQVVFGS